MITIAQRPTMNLLRAPGVSVFRTIGLDIRRFMIDRTKSGEDVNHKAFRGYAPITIAIREELGKTTDTVNLEFRGEMHRSMAINPANSQVSIFYSDRNRGTVALRHQTGTARLPKREHFGLMESDAANFLEKLAKSISDDMRKRAK